MTGDLSAGPQERGSAEARAAAADGRFLAGDPIRGAAALMIVTYHAAYGILIEVARAHPEFRGDFFGYFYGDVFGSIVRNFDFSIYIFLALSGYLIGRPFIRAFVTGDAHPHLWPYLRNRALRILPALWAVFTILLIRNGADGSSAGEVAAVYGLAQTFVDSPAAYLVGPAWTVNVEACFYLLVPLAAWLVVVAGGRRLGRRGRTVLVAAMLAVVTVSSLAATELLPDTFAAKRSFLALAFGFVPGLALALVEIDAAPRARARGSGAGVALGLAAAGLAAVVLYGVVLGTEQGFLPRVGWLPRALAALAAGLFVAAPLVHQWSGRKPWRALDNRPLHWFGTRSYSAYLLHTGVFIEAFLIVGPSGNEPREELLLVMLVGLPLLCLASAISFRLFEQPFLRRRRRWRV